MSKKIPTVAVILAGGVGTRVGLAIPKQLVKIAGRPVIEHTIRALHQSPDIDEIMVLMAPGYVDNVLALNHNGEYPKLTTVLEGGETRNETTKRALDALTYKDAKVLFHDAVRPLVDQRIIHDLVVALDRYDAVDTAIASADTIIKVNSRNEIKSIPPRDRLRRGQTPQAFKLSVLRQAYDLAWQDPDFSATDDCTVVLQYLPDVPIFVVEGTVENMKVTEPIDIVLMDKLFQLHTGELLPSTPVAKSTFVGKTIVVFGGSYGIGGDIVTFAREAGATVFSFSRSQTQTHVQRREDVRSALEQAFNETGRIDAVVNTTGILIRERLDETSDESVYESTNVNYIAPIIIAQESYPYLRRTHGHLLLFTSSSYTRGRASYALYSSTKAAIVNLTQALADEWANEGVKVNCINPDRTATPMREKSFGQEDPDTLLTSSEVAHVSLQCISSNTTGQVLDIRKLSSTVAPSDPNQDTK